MSRPRIDMTDWYMNEHGVLDSAWHVLYPSKNRTGYWHCECMLCGQRKDVLGTNLRNGNSKSDGCCVSKGQKEIVKWLSTQKELRWVPQFKIPELVGRGGFPLKFDFAILSPEGGVMAMIEYNGGQHYDTNSTMYNEDVEKNLQSKKEYCAAHDIIYCEISYKDNIQLTVQKLINQLTKLMQEKGIYGTIIDTTKPAETSKLYRLISYSGSSIITSKLSREELFNYLFNMAIDESFTLQQISKMYPQYLRFISDLRTDNFRWQNCEITLVGEGTTEINKSEVELDTDIVLGKQEQTYTEVDNKERYFSETKPKTRKKQINVYTNIGPDNVFDDCIYHKGNYYRLSIQLTDAQTAARYFGVKTNTIYRDIKEQKLCKGFILKYNDEDPMENWEDPINTDIANT